MGKNAPFGYSDFLLLICLFLVSFELSFFAMSEFAFIDWIRSQQRATSRVLVPACDDLAILKNDPDDLLLVGIDQVLDGVHFDSSKHSPEQIGAKVINRNLSDCAAMACLPSAAVVSVALPKGTDGEYAKRLYLGMKRAGEAFDCPIVGGDTGSWDQRLALSVAIVGRSAGIAPVRRSGARTGDSIYVTGPLGGSILGRHLTFTPRIREARELATRHRISSMIDLSDGLSRDLAHLCRESGVGAVIDASLIPIHDDVRTLAGDPLEHALHDGEDHELCFTSPDRVDRATRIGTVVTERGVWIELNGSRQSLNKGGFEHHF